jgi:hypothetical protein
MSKVEARAPFGTSGTSGIVVYGAPCCVPSERQSELEVAGFA